MEDFRRNLNQLREGLQPTSKEMRSEEEIARKQMIIHEAKRAAVAWFVAYGICFLCLLGYRWQTKGYYQAEYERKIAALENDIPGTAPHALPWWTIPEERVEEATRNMLGLKKSQEEKLLKLKQQITTAQDMKIALDQLDFSAESTEEKIARSSESLERLLEHAALAEISSTAALNQFFVQAVEDLKAIVSSPENMDWASLYSSLSSDFPEKVPSEDTSVSVPAGAARMSDLEQHVKAVYDVLDKRSRLVAGGDLPDAFLPETGARLEQLTRQGIDEALDAIISALAPGKSASDNRSNGPCLGEIEILEIVDEGLLAMQKHADLRNALRKKVMELDPSATSIILDADLPPPTPKIPPRETINLRRVLETPLLLKLADGIDRIVEMAGGHNDQLDQWLDSVVVGRESVGGLVVRRLLEESGKVEIPTLDTVKSRLPPQAREVLNKASNLVLSVFNA
jgi:hypothetical protein